MKPTLLDIARQTGLSVATVSRALHRDDSRNVSHETRERVRLIAREMGYRPNLLSRSLVTGRTHTVSYWTFDAFSPYYATVARAVCDQASQRGYYVHIHNTFDPAHDLGADEVGLAFSFDGVIACDVAYAGNDYASDLRTPNVPVVGIGFSHPRDCDYVNLDLDYGTHQAMDHLLSLGCRRIAHMTHQNALTGRERRALVYDARMRAAGLPSEWIPVAAHERAAARAAIVTYVREKGVPEAIFCVNDTVAIGCYRGLADLGLEVPDDVRLVGCDGIEEAAYQHCPITTIAAPITEMCALAWDFLEARIREPEIRLQAILLKPTLLVRESTGGKPAPAAAAP